MYVRDLKPLSRHFRIRYGARQAEVECRRCGRKWTTSRLNGREPRHFWCQGGPRRRPPDEARALERHWATPHSPPHLGSR